MCAIASLIAIVLATPIEPDDKADNRLLAQHYFDLESVSDSRISPDGRSIVYVRTYRDIMADRSYSNLWLVTTDGARHRPLTTGKQSDSSPRWSKDGRRLVFTSDREGSSQIFVRFMDDGQLLRITNTPQSPSNLSWSPDGRWIAFVMPVPADKPEGVKMPFKPEGAKWADPPVVIDKLVYRFDKRGYLKHEYRHIFIVPATGGTPRQLTRGDYDHQAPSWSVDGTRLVFSAIRKPDAEWIVGDSEVYAVDLEGNVETLTQRAGPDNAPVVSSDGQRIAYVGFDEKWQAYQVTRLSVMNTAGENVQVLTPELDRSPYAPKWSPNGKAVYFLIADKGNRHIHVADLSGDVRQLTEGTAQFPQFTISNTGRFAAVMSDPTNPGDIVTFTADDSRPIRLTAVNGDVLAHRELGTTEEIRYKSSFDGLPIQGWIVKPPDFDPQKKYPLVLRIHGGPHAMYGVNFQFEFQVHAAQDQVVLYTNPRGSTGYGEHFGNIIQYKYPGDDYHDLMTGVDQVIQRGYIDEKNLFVSGGSGGGVLTCWVIGRTGRFAAAVSQYPVTNWYSFLLTCDITAYCRKRWFIDDPWRNSKHYMDRSPISLVGNVTTPCMLITGTEDWRTPISETEQYYQALKLQKKDTLMVRVPQEAHGIRGKPSHYVAKVLHVQKWFDDHQRGGEQDTE